MSTSRFSLPLLTNVIADLWFSLTDDDFHIMGLHAVSTDCLPRFIFPDGQISYDTDLATSLFDTEVWGGAFNSGLIKRVCSHRFERVTTEIVRV